MRILVCGGRDYKKWGHVHNELSKITENMSDIIIIHGGARGADTHAGNWAEAYGHQCLVYFADWDKHGKTAGWVRNHKMLEEGKPDLVVAFPGGEGTAMMVKLAKQAGVKVIEIS